MKQLIYNARILSMDPQQLTEFNGWIRTENGRITSVEAGSTQTLPGEETLDARGHVLMPGFVNAHTHSPMVLLRGLADDTPLNTWLFEHIIPAERKLTPADIARGTRLAMAEMLLGGVTCFADMYFHMDEIAAAVDETGMRANISFGPITSAARTGEGFIVDEDSAETFFRRWNGKADGRIRTSIEIHSVYLYNEELIARAAALAERLDADIHIHVSETQWETQTSIQMYGRTPTQVLRDTGVLKRPVFAAHGVYLTREDRDLLRAANATVVHNPGSNLKLGSGIAPVPEMLEEGLRVALGTDGAASNNNLDMMMEARLAALIHKGLRGDAAALPAVQVLKMATAAGAEGLGFTDTGMIRAGNRADFILVSLDDVSVSPAPEAAGSIVYAANRNAVRHVWVNGKMLMKDRELQTIDLDKLIN